MERDRITPRLAAALVASQFPRWATLPISPVVLAGWDNVTFRLGDDLCIRHPSAPIYEAQVEKEQRWLPRLAGALPLPIRELVARGRPGEGFPRPWSIYRWLDGTPASLGRVADPVAFADDLGGFLSALYDLDADGGPPPGLHSFFRGGGLAALDAQTRGAIAALSDELDAARADRVWEEALGSAWSRPPVWVHGDVTASNLLVRDGRLAAVIDFGCAAVGDPACDLTMAWTFFDGESRAAFRRRLRFDEATWARARGWALWKVLITLARARVDMVDADGAARRFGWRWPAQTVADVVLADG